MPAMNSRRDIRLVTCLPDSSSRRRIQAARKRFTTEHTEVTEINQESLSYLRVLCDLCGDDLRLAARGLVTGGNFRPPRRLL